MARRYYRRFLRRRGGFIPGSGPVAQKVLEVEVEACLQEQAISTRDLPADPA